MEKLLHKVNFKEPMTEEESKRLINQFRELNNEEIRKHLIERNLRLVAYEAYKYKNQDSEDIFSVGCIGLIKAIDSYDPSKQTRFDTYANRCIQNEILLYIKRLKKGSRWTFVRLDAKNLSFDDGSSIYNFETLASDENLEESFIGREEKLIARSIIKDNLIEESIEEQSTKRQMAIRLRYQGLTQIDVSQRLGISQSYVARIEKRYQDKLYQKLRKMF
ncbi:RNA polymerase, sigma 28 subunit, FliA/WhiG family [Alkaliphilus metalliredigens QYMF]|uniref:RNA polymerase, sigma 28 subunit, FliA/WhiG family n=1 Tax=Alkaliphilus metalliredigens (strain QYMF) TaxID=293826 RepID=A6TKA8_ALKMQ|nr:sigma-70 family RNA polymerase sigma factor [Alkaliphilus metalliredigens]ABR46626.1 RNA polymerase, sigma 28 subunit, FliA/WhiG family [Alkaliphilus metalliredigens QYMF]